MDEKLQQLIDLQREQNQLLKTHLWRLRFSLATLLLLTTGACIVLGYMAYRIRTASFPVALPAGPVPVFAAPYSAPPVVGQPIPPMPTKRMPDGTIYAEPAVR
jgi:hypothetical protein